MRTLLDRLFAAAGYLAGLFLIGTLLAVPAVCDLYRYLVPDSRWAPYVSIGGKLGIASGAPLDLSVRVMGLAKDARQPFGGSMAPLGDLAWLRVGVGSGAGHEHPDDHEAIDIVVNESRIQSFHPECFRQAGIDPSRYRALVVKSTQHFHAGFAPIAREILYLTAPGTGSMNFASLPHTRVTQPLWPKVANPHPG